MVCQAEATAQVVESLHPTAVLALGDEQYDSGAADAYASSYDKSWGRFKAITHPVPGNHEYAGGQARGYFAYWGGGVQPWYSFDIGTWHLLALNANCGFIGGCGPGSPEVKWIAADLAAHPAQCTLAFWHQPFQSSGLHGSTPAMVDVWAALAAAHVDVVLSGHDHDYERFAPRDGIRQFVAGTGGRSIYPHGPPIAGSEVVSSAGFGVLQLTLRRGGYDWRFVAAAGNAFTDSGSAACQ